MEQDYFNSARMSSIQDISIVQEAPTSTIPTPKTVVEKLDLEQPKIL